MSPLVRGLRYTTLALALGAVGVGVFGVAGGRLELPWLRIGGAPEIDVSEGPNLTPPGFDAAFFAEQRDPQGELAWRFAGRQAVAESFSAGACSEPELVLYQQGAVALRLEAERARISATDPQGLAWLPGGVSEIRDVVVDLQGGVAVRAGELVLEAAAGRATLVRAVDDADGVPLERAPDAEVARLVLTGPVRVRGRDPAGAEVEGTAAGLTLVASGGTVAAPGWLSLDAEALDGRWGARRLRCAVGRARWARLPSVAAAATGGLGGAVQVAPAAPLGSASYLLVDGALEGDVAVSADGGGARAARVRRVDDGWLAEGAPVRVEATQGSWVEAPRIVARFGRGLELTAEGDVRGEAVAPATSAALPQRWPFSGERLELVAGDGPQRLERAALHGAPATLGAGPSRLRAGRVELEQDPAERTLRLSGGAELELAADLAQGAPLRARLEQGELRLAADVAALGSLQPQDVRGAALRGLQELAWGESRGRAGRLDYRRDGDRGLLTGREVDLAVAAVTSDAPAPFELRAQDLFARLDPAGLAGEADPLVRLARTVEEAELRGDARVGRGGPEPRHLSAARIELRDRRLRASGGAALAGTDPRGAWSVAAREARAELARDPARWGSGPATRRWLRDHGLPFVPPPFVERLELEGDVRGTATRQVRDERQQAELRGERLDYDAETRIARLTRGGLSVGPRRLEAEELLAWWTLLGEQPLVWLGVRAPVLEGAPPTSGARPSRLGTTRARAAWLHAVLYSAFPGFELPPLWAWSAGGAEGVRVRSDGEVALRLDAPRLHGQGRELTLPSGPVTLALGEVELEAARGRLSLAEGGVRAELADGWSARFALPGKGPTPPDQRYRAQGQALSLELDLAAATELQALQGRTDPELARRAVRSLAAEGGIEVEGPNLRARGQAARREVGAGVTWLEGDPAQVERGGMSYRGRRLELELR